LDKSAKNALPENNDNDEDSDEGENNDSDKYLKGLKGTFSNFITYDSGDEIKGKPKEF